MQQLMLSAYGGGRVIRNHIQNVSKNMATYFMVFLPNSSRAMAITFAITETLYNMGQWDQDGKNL